MYTIFSTASFKKRYKKLQSEDKELLKVVIVLLAENKKLEEKYKDHKLTGNNCRIGHDKVKLHTKISKNYSIEYTLC